MERRVWLAERRAALVAVYDAEAATYGDGRQPWDVQREWMARVLGLIAPGGIVLDAPCGTGTYFPMLAPAGHRVAGADQSAGMLEGDTLGYHYFPGRDQAVDWFWQQGLAILDEGFWRGNGWDHHHFLLRLGPALPAP